MFSAFMINAWEASTIVALVAGIAGFFTVLRGASFAAHALPNGAFAGAAGASLVGISTVLGLGVFAIIGAIIIASLGHRARSDVATALAMVVMLGLGALFLSMTTEYAPQIYSLLFGEILGISSTALVPTAAMGALCAVAIFGLYRPLMLSSLVPDTAEARGISAVRTEICFLLVLALVTTMAVPVVGTLLIFSLLVSPAATARSFTKRPGAAMGISVAFALTTVWAAIAVSYVTGLPIGFFVGAIGAVLYSAGRAWASWRQGARSTHRKADRMASSSPSP
ncbi:MAG: metal ABC transporter permease [Acidimicrobiales bacterium]